MTQKFTWKQDFAKAETQKNRKGWSVTQNKYMESVIGKNRGQKILPHWVCNQTTFWEGQYEMRD